MDARADVPSPHRLVAELTHRCPLGCPYCFNPLALERLEDELDVLSWARIFGEAAALGVAEVHLSGGEPGVRRDLVDIAASAREAGLITHLLTSGGISTRTLRDLWEAGLAHVHVSLQDADAVSADRIAGKRGSFQRKYALAVEAVRLGLPLTVNVVVHRANIGRIGAMVDLALELKAARLELSAVRDCGWAQKNRAALTPDAEAVARAAAEVNELRHRHVARIDIDAEFPDRRGDAGGPARRVLTVSPSGRVSPCSAAPTGPGRECWSVRDRPLAEIWRASPAFVAARGHGTCICEASERPVGEAAADGDGQPFTYRRM